MILDTFRNIFERGVFSKKFLIFCFSFSVRIVYASYVRARVDDANGTFRLLTQ